MTDMQGIFINTAEMQAAVAGFRAASTDTKNYVETMRSELAGYANNPDAFQGPAADEFRRLHREISDDLDRITAETNSLSSMVETANTTFVQESNRAAGEMPGGSGGGSAAPAGGSIRSGLTGN